MRKYSIPPCFQDQDDDPPFEPISHLTQDHYACKLDGMRIRRTQSSAVHLHFWKVPLFGVYRATIASGVGTSIAGVVLPVHRRPAAPATIPNSDPVWHFGTMWNEVGGLAILIAGDERLLWSGGASRTTEYLLLASKDHGSQGFDKV